MVCESDGALFQDSDTKRVIEELTLLVVNGTDQTGVAHGSVVLLHDVLAKLCRYVAFLSCLQPCLRGLKRKTRQKSETGPLPERYSIRPKNDFIIS